MLKQILLFLFFVLYAGWVHAQQILLQEDFKENKVNAIAQITKVLGSGEWLFYYTDKNYNSMIECAVLKYSGANMGYIITPSVSQPAMLTFDARMVGNASNILEIQKSVNGGAYITVEKVLVTGQSYKPYTINLNETSLDVKIKFLRTKPTSDGSNYNIMIDNVQISGRLAPMLQVTNGNIFIESCQTICLNGSNASYMEMPFTLTNVGKETLIVSDIETFGMCSVVGDKPELIAVGSSSVVTARIKCSPIEQPVNSFMLIHTNTSESDPFIVKFTIN